MYFLPTGRVIYGIFVLYGAPANVIPGNKKPQLITVGVSYLVESAGIEPASASPLLSALHA